MTRVLRFHTGVFDVSKERPNPINPIPGESLLLWLIDRARGSVPISPPDTEDWGWYSYADWKGRKYLVGACTYEPDENGEREWVLQIEKLRSMKEKLIGSEKMSQDDDCARYFQQLLEREASFRDVSVDPEP